MQFLQILFLCYPVVLHVFKKRKSDWVINRKFSNSSIFFMHWINKTLVCSQITHNKKTMWNSHRLTIVEICFSKNLAVNEYNDSNCAMKVGIGINDWDYKKC